MAKELRDKRILVTGGTSGIGRAVVVQAARAGADVAFCGLTEQGAQETIEAVHEAGRRAYFEALDLSDLVRARRFAQAAVAFLGGLDGLVNNAGTNFFHGVLGARKEDVERCFAVDFYPAWALSQEAYEPLRNAGGGAVVNIASIHAERTAPGAFPYNAAKAALVALTKSQALEWGRDNIRAVAVLPALILTALAEDYFRGFDDPASERARLERHYPLARAGQPEEVASLVIYLLGDSNGFMNGNTVLLDGGISALLESPE